MRDPARLAARAFERLTSEDQARVLEARGEIADAWAHGSFHDGLAGALHDLVPCVGVALTGWTRGPRRLRLVSAAVTGPVDMDHGPWAEVAIRHNAYDPRRLDARANRVVPSWLLEQENRRGFAVFRELFLRPQELEHQLRATLYDGERFVKFVAFFRGRGDAPFSARDEQLFEAILPELREAMILHGAMAQGSVPVSSLLLLLDEMPRPAFVGNRSGIVLHANPAARAAHQQRPAWLGAALRGEDVPPGVRRIPLTIDGQSLWVVQAGGLTLETSRAWETIWARQWRLPRYLARVAAELLRGASDKEAAATLGLSASTIRTYVKEVFRRAGVKSRAQLVAAAARIGA